MTGGILKMGFRSTNRVVFLAAALSFLILAAAGCKEKFDPPIKNVTTNFLVVEGVVNVGNDESNIRLSRTVGLKSDSLIVERGAQVKIEGEDNSSIILPEKGNGDYGVSSIFLDTSIKYRLSINTSNGQQYVSDFVKMVRNPPIDSINWERTADGLQIYINNHDADNATRYFRWQYDETWEHHAAYTTILKYVFDPSQGNQITGVDYRDQNDPKIYECWTSQNPSAILLGSTEKLSKAAIHLPLRFIPNAAQELSVKYYIHVKQFALSKEGYQFFERLKKNTESLGSIFDAQPSQLGSNIKCVSNPDEPVVGFFNLSNFSEASIYIKATEANWRYNMGCIDFVIDNNPDAIEKNGGGTLPTQVEAMGPFASIKSFRASPSQCVDCRLNGGTNVKPDFWQ